jgi:UDP-glucose 4-epimerase
MNVLVTGGAGFIGSHTVVELVNAGFSPVIIDNLNNSSESVLTGLKKIIGFDVPFYKADCNDFEVIIVFKDAGDVVQLVPLYNSVTPSPCPGDPLYPPAIRPAV